MNLKYSFGSYVMAFALLASSPPASAQDGPTSSNRVRIATSATKEPDASTTDSGGTHAVSPAKMKQIGELLTKYNAELGSLKGKFERQDHDTEKRKVELSPDESQRLQQATESFFRDLAAAGLNREDLQRFRSRTMTQQATSSEGVLFGGKQYWDATYLGTERALMMGRSQMVQQIWMETLREYFERHPEAVGRLYAEIDIGSWVKMNLGGLSFDADIDFSSVSTDSKINREVVQLFADKLHGRTATSMVDADALLTAHGQATADVFIGEWGKTFAEMDMLKRTKWKIIVQDQDGKLVKDDNGFPTFKERAGEQLFWEDAIRAFENDKIVKEVPFPQMTIETEPMLSLEMFRHEIHDVEHGPFERGAKLVKVLKYLERSYAVNRKALAAYRNSYPEPEPRLGDLATRVVEAKGKGDVAGIAEAIRDFTGGELNEGNVDSFVRDIEKRAQTAMHDNACRALAFRLNQISQIEDETGRRQAAEKLWKDLDTEIKKGFAESGITPPETLVKAAELAKKYYEGDPSVDAAELERRAQALHDLLNESYAMEDSVLARLIGSQLYQELRVYLRDNQKWADKEINEFVEGLKKKYPRTSDVVSKVTGQVKEFNEQWEKTAEGSKLLKASDFAGNALAVYDAYIAADNPGKGCVAAVGAMAKIKAMGALPSLSIVEGVWNAYEQGEPGPAIKAVAFYYLPGVGAFWSMGEQLQRLDVAARDAEFYTALNTMRDRIVFTDKGHIVLIKTKLIDLDVADSDDPEQRANNFANVFMKESWDGMPEFRYWMSLVPRENTEYGYSKSVVNVQDKLGIAGYNEKYARLRKFFAYNEQLSTVLLVLENYRKDNLPADQFSEERAKKLAMFADQVERAIWKSLAYTLEASAAPPGDLAELQKKLESLEQDLSVGDIDLKDLRGANMGIVSQVKKELKANSSYWAGTNQYNAKFVYERYLSAYERVKQVQGDIFALWRDDFGIDVQAVQAAPMRFLLYGSASAAPRLTGNPDHDPKLAESCLAAHLNRGRKIHTELADALGRPFDPQQDKEHLKILAQLGIEWEHLLDGCPDRAKASCDEATAAAMTERYTKYKAYLDTLRAESGARTVRIEGPTTMIAGEMILLTAVLEPPVTNAPLQMAWSEEVQKTSLGEGSNATFTAQSAGKFDIVCQVVPAKSTDKAPTGRHTVTVTLPQFGIGISGPSSTVANKPVTLSANVTAADAAAQKVANLVHVEWVVDGKVAQTGASWSPDTSRARTYSISIQAVLGDQKPKLIVGSATQQLVVNEETDTTKKPDENTATNTTSTVTNTAELDTGKLVFSASAGGNWEGGNTEKGFVLTRKVAKIKAPCGWDASVSASVSASYGGGALATPADPTKDATELFNRRRQGDTPNDMSIGLYLGGGVEGVSSITLGKYSGAIADFAIWVGRGHGGEWSGYSGSYLGANGRGSAVGASGSVITFKYSVSGGGCWDNSDKAYLISQAIAAQQEAKAIIASLILGTDGTVKKEPYKGPAYDGSDLPKVVLIPAQLAKLKPGETVTLRAEVQNGKPEDQPFTYNWAGTFAGKPEDLKKSDSVTIKPDRPGKYDVSVGVEGARFGMGWAQLSYEVSDYRVTIERTPADSKPVPVGVKTAFKATLTCDGKPATGAFTYRWQPHPEVAFDKLDESTPDVNATSSKPGPVKVWVQVLEDRGGALATVCESPQIDLQIIKPQIEMAFEPKEPFIGQTVTARLKLTPDIKEIDFRWLRPPDSVKQLSESPDGREITFYLKDDKAAEINVTARVPVSGDDLGETKNSLKAKKFDVKVSGPKAFGPKPQVWKEGVGLVDVDKEIAVDQIVEFTVEVQPTPENGPLTYSWSVTSGSATLNNPYSRDIHAVAGASGSCELTVTAKDGNGLELGTGNGAFNATVSRDTVQKSKQRAKDVEEAKTKLATARDKARNGDLDGAINDADTAAKLDPSNADAARQAGQWRSDKKQIDDRLASAKKLSDDVKFPEAQRELDAAAAVNGNYAPLKEGAKALAQAKSRYETESQQKLASIQQASQEKDFKKALDQAAAWRASGKLTPATDAELKEREDAAGRAEADKESKRRIFRDAADKLAKKDYAGAAQAYDKGLENASGLWKISDPEYLSAARSREEAVQKNKRLTEIAGQVQRTAVNAQASADVLKDALKAADEGLALQPGNETLKRNRAALQDHLDKQIAGTNPPNPDSVKTGTAIAGVGSTTGSSSSCTIIDLSTVGGKKSPPRRVRDIDIDDSSWIRLKSSDEKRLELPISVPGSPKAGRVAFISNLDDATYLKQGRTIARLMVLSPEGNESFDIQAGIHSSEWNRPETSGADHEFPKDAHIGDKRFLAVFSLSKEKPVTALVFNYVQTDAAKWWGHDPGFCLRGVSLLSGGAGARNQSASAQTSATAPLSTAAKVIYDNGNIYTVYNEPTRPTSFTLREAHRITMIRNYHWNFGKGSALGAIALSTGAGREASYGPWKAAGEPGQGGVPNASWICKPDIVLPAGAYTVIDTDPRTWSRNDASGGAGITHIEGYPANEAATPPNTTATTPSPATQTGTPTQPNTPTTVVTTGPTGTAGTITSSMEGLIAWWNADGTYLDYVGRREGRAVGGVSFIPGQAGQAFRFDGTGYVEVEDDPQLHLTGTLTISFWAKRADPSHIDIIVEKGGDWTVGETAYGVGLHSANNHMFYLFFAGGWRGTAGPADTDWHHYSVVATSGKANPDFYIDGVARPATLGEGGSINFKPSKAPLHIGAQIEARYKYYSKAIIDDLKISSRAAPPSVVAPAVLNRTTAATPPENTPPTAPVSQPQTPAAPSVPGAVDISGTWTVMSAYDLQLVRTNAAYVGRLLTVTSGLSNLKFRVGDEVMRLKHVSAHVLKGDYMKRDSSGKPFWDPCAIGVDGNELYMGEPTERDPTQGMTYAMRKK